ncbi:hypothetical protein LCGC14_2739970 [marine sediment metagenome]|uniref:Uncharacterized protein n=1 Tax=marine sediment metagenome TaxID=412755 RepID=A0A0F8Z4Q9_9ZZZZ
MKNRIIDHRDCPSCDGSGKLEVWLAPPPCTPDCVKKLREYPQGREGMMWLCDKPSHPIPTLWRPAERTRCLKAFTGQIVEVDTVHPEGDQREGMIHGWAKFETGRVIHLLRVGAYESFYRVGVTHCNRTVDEEREAVEMYQGVPESLAEKVVCSRCQKELARREAQYPQEKTVEA